MAVPFSRSLRSLNADNFRLTLIGLGFAMLLLGVWCMWFFAARITLHETSQQARLVSSVHGEFVVAEFPKEELSRIARGQPATFVPDGLQLEIGSLAAVVVEVTRSEEGQGQVTLVLLHKRRTPVKIPRDATGQVDIAVENISPARMVLRAAGLGDDNALTVY